MPTLDQQTDKAPSSAMPTALFSPETAREMQKRANESRKRNRLAKLEAAEKAKTPPEPPPKPAADSYCLRRLSRVRKQLDRIDAMLLEEIDPTKMDRLAAASAKLAEQERQLSDRPLPGTKKPESRPSRAAPEPEVEPVPIVPSAPQ